VTSDDKFLFVSEEAASAVTVIDLDHARSARFGAGSIIGKIPVGRAPIALTFSPDERAGLFPKNQSENRPPRRPAGPRTLRNIPCIPLGLGKRVLEPPTPQADRRPLRTITLAPLDA